MGHQNKFRCIEIKKFNFQTLFLKPFSKEIWKFIMTIDSISSEDNPRLSENTSLPGASATAYNGATGSPSTNSSNNNVNNIRKTLAKWLHCKKEIQAAKGD